MPKLERSSRVPYSAERMFDLVNDVEAYPEFLPWCSGARIERRAGNVVEAAVDVGLGGIRKTFRTRNTLHAPAADGGRIDIALLSGPFSRLEGAWTFDTVEGGCEIGLELDYEIASMPLGMLFARVFEEITLSQMDAFLRRADQLYGHD